MKLKQIITLVEFEPGGGSGAGDMIDATDFADNVDDNTVDGNVSPSKYFNSLKEKNPGKNYKKAKKIVSMVKRHSEKNNPKETDTPHGWRAGPHQGSHISNFLNR